MCKPMPTSWHDHYAINRDVDDEHRELYHEIVADKKPYFMCYIYPTLMRQYNTYVKNSNKNAFREFGISVNDIIQLDEAERSDRMSEFLKYYNKSLPVGICDCTMNRICKKFEEAFDGYLIKNKPSEKFDCSIMKSGSHYTKSQVARLGEFYATYNRRVRDLKVYAQYERVDDYEMLQRLAELRDEFLRQCAIVCPDRHAMCDMLLDLCYKKNSSKGFVWELCGREIIENLLRRSGMVVSYPARDDSGDILYHGERFAIYTTELEWFDEYNLE